MEASNGGIPGKLSTWIAVGTAAIGLIAAWVALESDLFENEQAKECSMAGTVVSAFSGSPLRAVRLGFQPSESNQVVLLTRSGSDGSFSASCERAQDATATSSFELLAVGRSREGPLPCLSSERTGVFVDREGETMGLHVEIRGC